MSFSREATLAVRSGRIGFSAEAGFCSLKGLTSLLFRFYFVKLMLARCTPPLHFASQLKMAFPICWLRKFRDRRYSENPKMLWWQILFQILFIIYICFITFSWSLPVFTKLISESSWNSTTQNKKYFIYIGFSSCCFSQLLVPFVI